MMLVLGNGATADQSEEKNAMMMDDAEDADDVPSRIPSSSLSHGEDESGDEAAMSSSAMSSSGADRSARSSKRRSTRGGGAGGNHRRRRGSTSPSRNTRQTSKSPSRVSVKDDTDIKESTASRHKSSSSKVRPRSGRLSRTRSNDEERPNSSHERKTRTSKASSSAREGKSYAANSANSRSGRGADRTSNREGSKHRRRKQDNDGDRDDNAGHDSNEVTKSILPTKETSDSRHSVKKHASSGRPRHRSKSRSRSLAKAGIHTDINGTKEESTLDSTSDAEPDPSKSLRSSVKVASALSKFRMVLAKSKQATKAAEKYHTDRDKHGKQRENLKNGVSTSSRHKRDRRESSRHKSSRHRREAKDDDGDNTEMVRKSSSRSKDSVASSDGGSTKKEDSQPKDSPDDMLMNALSNVGRKLAQEKRERKKAQESSNGKDEGETTKATKEVSSSARLKTSAKVSTAMLKFQQALALSKSATLAAKNQQATQNKLLGEVHSGTKPVATPDDYRLKKSEKKGGATSIAVQADVSPVSTVDMVESPKSKDSPKVPTDLDGENNKDLDCHISVDDASKEGDDAVMSLSGSEVEIDSEDEMDSDIDSEFEIGSVSGDDDVSVNSEAHTATGDPAGIADIKPPAVVTPETLIGETNSVDMDSDSSISDHSSVVIDSDDELDSDGEFDNDADEEAAVLDNDSNLEADLQKNEKMEVSEDKEAIKELLTTPQQSSWNGDTGNVFQEQSANGAQQGEGALANALGSNEVTEISRRLKIARSLSFTSSTSGGQDRSLSNWKPSSSRELNKASCPNLAIPGLSPPSKTTSLLDDSQPSPSYLPATMKHSDKVDVLISEAKKKPIDNDKRSRNLTRKPSSRSLRKSKSAVGASTKQVLDDSSSGGGGRRRSSRMRKPPSRSRSSTGAILKAESEGGSLNDRKSKTSSRSAHRSKSRERSGAPKRSSSASRAKLLAGVSALVKTASTENTRDEVRRPSSRRKTPSRAKSHDIRPKSSRSSSTAATSSADTGSEVLEKEARRSRRKSNDGI